MKMKNFKGVVFIVLAACLFSAEIIYADIAPPLQPPGANPSPAGFAETDIVMAYESVTIYVEESGRLYYSSPVADTVNGHVTATFMMENPSSRNRTLDVVFPISNIEGYGDGRFGDPEVQNFNVSVNDTSLKWDLVTTTNPHGEDEQPIRWAQFKVEFSSEELTYIDVSYDVQSTGYFPIAAFSYILETGTGWAGPIGEVHLTLVLPYEASEENVLIGSDIYYGMGGENNPIPEFDGNEVQWHWENLEPTREDNWAVAIFAPHIWQEIITLREEMDQGKRGAAREITEWYDALIIDRGIRQGSEGLIDLNIKAYQHAMAEEESNEDVRARYASFLLFLYEFGRNSDKYPGMLDEIYRLASDAHEVDKFNPTALEVLNQLKRVHEYIPASANSEPSDDTAVQPVLDELEEESDDEKILSSSDKKWEKAIVYLLAIALGVALMVIFFLIYRIEQIRKTH